MFSIQEVGLVGTFLYTFLWFMVYLSRVLIIAIPLMLFIRMFSQFIHFKW